MTVKNVLNSVKRTHKRGSSRRKKAREKTVVQEKYELMQDVAGRTAAEVKCRECFNKRFVGTRF